MNKILIALLISVVATSTIACQCPVPKKGKPLVCKTHVDYHIEEKANKEQERQATIKERQQKIKDAINKLDDLTN